MSINPPFNRIITFALNLFSIIGRNWHISFYYSNIPNLSGSP